MVPTKAIETKYKLVSQPKSIMTKTIRKVQHLSMRKHCIPCWHVKGLQSLALLGLPVVNTISVLTKKTKKDMALARTKNNQD